jgi:hypothetical protein
MNKFDIIFIILIFIILFVVSMFLTYLVEDYRRGIIYKGFLGKIQNIVKH